MANCWFCCCLSEDELSSSLLLLESSSLDDDEDDEMACGSAIFSSDDEEESVVSSSAIWFSFFLCLQSKEGFDAMMDGFPIFAEFHYFSIEIFRARVKIDGGRATGLTFVTES